MNDRRAHVGWRAAGLWARQRFLALDQPLFFVFCGLLGLSLLAVYSASHHEPDRFLSHVRNLALAATIMFTLAQVPSNWLQKAAIPLYSMGLILLIAVELFGDTSKGATRWLDLGVTRIQPSEIMKIAMPLMLAWVVHQRDGLKTIADWVVISVLLLLPVALILRQPDLGTAILVAASGIFVIYLAGLSWRLIAVVAGSGALLIGILVIFGDQACAPGVDWPGLREYQRQRVCTLLDPTRDPLGKGFHILQSMIAVGSGGIWGKGWLNGTQAQLDFIPERETDFIFSGFAEEFGFLGALLLTSLYIGLILRSLWVSLGAPTIFGRLLAASLALTTFTYAFVNLGMVTGLLPVVGVPLPFVSYGGTALVTLGVGMGLIMSVARDRSRMTQGFSLQG
ncbi:MAG: cell elongation-specific peptidoglycan biosynthesis regulator [Pseudomonadota bacterium]|jgi:rod shape determining protein RodA